MSPKPLTSAQIRAARALIRWSAQELATETASRRHHHPPRRAHRQRDQAHPGQ